MEIQGSVLVDILKELYSADNNQQLSKKIGVSAVNLGNWEKKPLSRTILKNVINLIIKKERNTLSGTDFIDHAKKKYQKETDADIAELLGITQPALNGWKNKGLTFRSIFEVFEKGKKAHTKTIVTPVIEFFPVSRMESRHGAKYETLDTSQDSHGLLQKELNLHNGVYIFYDSKGAAIYVGKAKKQSLWKEMNLAYNRKRDSQTVRRVKHLKINRFNSEEEKRRQIKSYKIYLHDMAAYFSAYRADSAFIDSLEAALIRMFPNNLLNKKVEQFKGL